MYMCMVSDVQLAETPQGQNMCMLSNMQLADV